MSTQPLHPIPFFNYPRTFQAIEEQVVAIVRDVIHRGAFIMQRDLEEFEARLADYLGVRHALGVANATDGLTMLWRAVGLQPGDEILFPSHTMVASPASVVHAGGVPVPVDCGPDHLMDPDAAERAIGPRTRGIMPVQLNGRTCDMDRICAIADKRGLVIIEDAAQALGSRFRDRPAGTFGRGAAFSFYPAKILGCLGDGGAVVTNDDEVARRVRLLRDHGRNEHGDVELWGLNSRLDNLQAAVLDFQLRGYGQVIEHRRSLARRYEDRLRTVRQVTLPPGPDEDTGHYDVYQNYEVEAERRDELRAHLSARGIGTLIQWGGRAVHQYAALGFTQSLPATDRLFTRCLMLPMNMTVTVDDVDRIAGEIAAFYGSALC
ncbi:MAG TPA: DegT/DnrJ/EryC1/StrS family aminotransferase [Chthonomonadales bacterium]|nr:DegT/DnrJ/EryC1/StrS family aminotransferase [Chthonomonadales bacterium]